MTKAKGRVAAALLALGVLAGACTEDEAADGGGTTPTSDGSRPSDAAPAELDFEALGLWDDGPCDEAREPLRIGLTTVFESAVLSLEDQATALEASAAAFNQRGGANGACIEVHTCDDGANPNQALDCVRELDAAGVVATVNDQNSVAAAEVSAAMAAAAIPRVAYATSSQDWGDQNAFPLDGAGFGVTFLLPEALRLAGVTEQGLIRVDIAAASALVGLLNDLYGDAGVNIPFDVPVPAGTTDYSQFIIAAQDNGVDGVNLALGEQEAVQVIRAAEQLGTDLVIGSPLGTFSHGSIAELGAFAEQMVFLWSFPPATVEVPVYEVLRADLAASGEEGLQLANLKASPMRSWIGLYGLLSMIRDAGMTEFTRPGITAMLESATDVPMLGIFGDANWTPDTDHPGAYQRAGISRWSTYAWDPDAPAPGGLTGNFVAGEAIDLDATICGSPFGAPEPC